MLRYFYISTVFSLLVLISGCKPEVELNTFTTDLKVVVKDKDGNTAGGVAVYIYDDEAQYQTNAPLNSATGAIATGFTDANGELLIEGLNHQLNYWIHVYFIDGGGFQQSNLTGQYALLNLLNEGAVTTVQIDLSQDNVGEAALWTTTDNSSNLGIEFFIEGTSQGTLTTTRGTSPTPSDQANALVSGIYIPGTYSWYAKGQNGCVWQGQVNIVADTIIPIQLADCDHGSVSFWTQADLTSEGTISVVIDQDNPIGTISSPIGAAPSACFQTGTVSTSLPVGTHIYQAYSSSGTCLWTDSFTVTENGCTIIELTDCE